MTKMINLLCYFREVTNEKSQNIADLKSDIKALEDSLQVVSFFRIESWKVRILFGSSLISMENNLCFKNNSVGLNITI